MPTYEYLKPGRAVALASEDARSFERIIGLRGMDAGRLRPPLSRTRAGYMREPEDSWRAYVDRDKFREIVSVVWSRDDGTGQDAEDGMITVTFADGESTYLNEYDLLCVEHPV
jgi:hypothetical protein